MLQSGGKILTKRESQDMHLQRHLIVSFTTRLLRKLSSSGVGDKGFYGLKEREKDGDKWQITGMKRW